MGRTGAQFRNAATCKVEAEDFGKFTCESHVIVEETSGDGSRAAQGHNGDIRSPIRLVGVLPARGAGGRLYR